MKKKRGFTTSMLLIYLAIGAIFLGSFATIVTMFSRQMYRMNGYCEQQSQYAIFNARFVKDMKANTSVSSITATNLTLGDGTVYRYANNTLYRYDVPMIKNIMTFQFSSNTVNTKQVITLTYKAFSKGATVAYTTNYVLGRGY